METTNSDLISEQAEYIYREIGEGYGFNGPEDLALAVIQNKLDEYATDVATSQKQTIERLREAVKDFFITWDEKPDYALRKAVQKLRKEAEQLLNTTEPTNK